MINTLEVRVKIPPKKVFEVVSLEATILGGTSAMSHKLFKDTTVGVILRSDLDYS